MIHKQKKNRVSIAGIKTMAGFIVPSNNASFLMHRDGRWFSPSIEKLYNDVNNDILDSMDAYETMHKLFKQPGSEVLMGSMMTLKDLNEENEIAIIRSYTKDYHGFHAGRAPNEWDHLAFTSIIAMLVEANKGLYTGVKGDVVNVMVPRDLFKEMNKYRRYYIRTWLRRAGWRDFIRMLWLVYGDVRQYEAAYMDAKKKPVVKVKLG